MQWSLNFSVQSLHRRQHRECVQFGLDRNVTAVWSFPIVSALFHGARKQLLTFCSSANCHEWNSQLQLTQWDHPIRSPLNGCGNFLSFYFTTKEITEHFVTIKNGESRRFSHIMWMPLPTALALTLCAAVFCVNREFESFNAQICVDSMHRASALTVNWPGY